MRGTELQGGLRRRGRRQKQMESQRHVMESERYEREPKTETKTPTQTTDRGRQGRDGRQARMEPCRRRREAESDSRESGSRC